MHPFKKELFPIWFLLPFLIFSVTGYVLLLLFTNESLFDLLTIKSHHPKFIYHLFYWIDFLGNGFFFLAVLIILFFLNRHYFRAGLISWGLTALLVNLLKYVIFPNTLRPLRIFSEHPSLLLLKDMDVLAENSFPSGHSASVFALFFLISVFFRNKWISLASFALAFLAAYSRVYLFQHFPADILAGSFIGVVCSWVGVYLMRKKLAN